MIFCCSKGNVEEGNHNETTQGLVRLALFRNVCGPFFWGGGGSKFLPWQFSVFGLKVFPEDPLFRNSNELRDS